MNDTANVAIRAEDVCKSYGSRQAIRNLNMAVPAHSVTAILGPNGAGKSTLMRMITGMETPDTGTFSVLGRKPSWELNRWIAYLPDRAQWYSHHMVEHALEWARTLQPGFNEMRARDLMVTLDLDASMKVEGMSKGEEARLMLALCLARDVPLLVLDEPFSGIDMISRERIVAALIDSFSEREQTVLISTHEIAETESLFDYAVFVDKGVAVLAGDVERMRAERGSLQQVYRQLYG
ncbi:ABC transporter ATP-binding protein [Cohnella terricola]|uniref:ABC transporter ATP-binding protein n=1 Tax=Cohnella terricola TaxID=1289167 RepID=A0A559JWX3_9BACL|nr:ABC transporter ATP-binding protein [Cohnella terricola]TVY04395.1 ABC transporter ATP-binding protein [Cohnella terricola]